jgi:hypothetical protein
MSGQRGGEPDGARLLALARRELLEELLPQLQGEASYRARLIANALKIAAHELDDDEAARTEAVHRLRGLAAAALPGGTDVAAMADAEIAAALCAALRAGRLDGQREFHALLGRLTELRRAVVD